MRICNIQGKELTSFVYDEIKDLFNGIAILKRNHKYGAVDREGIEFIPCIYDSIKPLGKLFFKINKNDKFGIANNKGVIIVPCIYSEIEDYYNSNELFSIRMVNGFGVFGLGHGEVIPCIYGSRVWFAPKVSDSDYIEELFFIEEQNEQSYPGFLSMQGVEYWED